MSPEHAVDQAPFERLTNNSNFLILLVLEPASAGTGVEAEGAASRNCLPPYVVSRNKCR